MHVKPASANPSDSSAIKSPDRDAEKNQKSQDRKLKESDKSQKS